MKESGAPFCRSLFSVSSNPIKSSMKRRHKSQNPEKDLIFVLLFECLASQSDATLVSSISKHLGSNIWPRYSTWRCKNVICWSSAWHRRPLSLLVFRQSDEYGLAQRWKRWSLHTGIRGKSSTWTVSRKDWSPVANNQAHSLIQMSFLCIGMFPHGRQTRYYIDTFSVFSSAKIPNTRQAFWSILLHQVYGKNHNSRQRVRILDVHRVMNPVIDTEAVFTIIFCIKSTWWPILTLSARWPSFNCLSISALSCLRLFGPAQNGGNLNEFLSSVKSMRVFCKINLNKFSRPRLFMIFQHHSDDSFLILRVFYEDFFNG